MEKIKGDAREKNQFEPDTYPVDIPIFSLFLFNRFGKGR